MIRGRKISNRRCVFQNELSLKRLVFYMQHLLFSRQQFLDNFLNPISMNKKLNNLIANQNHFNHPFFMKVLEIECVLSQSSIETHFVLFGQV